MEINNRTVRIIQIPNTYPSREMWMMSEENFDLQLKENEFIVKNEFIFLDDRTLEYLNKESSKILDKVMFAITFGKVIESKNVNYFDADKVGKMIIEKFEKGEFDVCTIFFNKFKNVITQIPQEQQIIPLKSENSDDKNDVMNYEFEPEEDEILEDLLPKNITTQVFKAFWENAASEQGSRMSAMDNATRNAGDMIDSLSLKYNRQRQAMITKELNFFRALLCIESEFFPYSKSYSLVNIRPGNFPGFRATIMGLDDSRATAEPKINPRASTAAIFVNLFFLTYLEISRTTSLKSFLLHQEFMQLAILKLVLNHF